LDLAYLPTVKFKVPMSVSVCFARNIRLFWRKC
jgi:hypothetical protein